VPIAQDIPDLSPSYAAQAQVLQAPLADDVEPHPTAVDPVVKEPPLVTKANVQQVLGLSQKLWNDAYDRIETDENKLVEGYRKTLAKVLLDEMPQDPIAEKATNAPAFEVTDGSAELEKRKAVLSAEISAELKDRTRRQMHLEKLVKQGQAKVAKASKVTKGIGAVTETILSIKSFVDPILQNIPQAAPAALPWAGICVGLQVHNPQHHSWFPDQLISIRYSQIQQKRRNLTLQVSFMLLSECSGTAPSLNIS
jgi:hypothetical protein